MKLSTPQEQYEYLNHNKLECLECHTRYQKLAIHLAHIHDMKKSVYKIKWGLPQTCTLVGGHLANTSFADWYLKLYGEVYNPPPPPASDDPFYGDLFDDILKEDEPPKEPPQEDVVDEEGVEPQAEESQSEEPPKQDQPKKIRERMFQFQPTEYFKTAKELEDYLNSGWFECKWCNDGRKYQFLHNTHFKNIHKCLVDDYKKALGVPNDVHFYTEQYQAKVVKERWKATFKGPVRYKVMPEPVNSKRKFWVFAVFSYLKRKFRKAG